jgi:hypothetical protein
MTKRKHQKKVTVDDVLFNMAERWVNEKPDPKMDGKRTAWNQVV